MADDRSLMTATRRRTRPASAESIDPDAYYTVYADRSERRYDAASVRRLYLKLERPQFYALFGDYETGIDEPELARYVRAFNGVKAEYRSDRISAIAFAADSPNRHRRDEIQGNGLQRPLCARRPRHPRQFASGCRSRFATGFAPTGSSSAAC